MTNVNKIDNILNNITISVPIFERVSTPFFKKPPLTQKRGGSI